MLLSIVDAPLYSSNGLLVVVLGNEVLFGHVGGCCWFIGVTDEACVWWLLFGLWCIVERWWKGVAGQCKRKPNEARALGQSSFSAGKNKLTGPSSHTVKVRWAKLASAWTCCHM